MSIKAKFRLLNWYPSEAICIQITFQRRLMGSEEAMWCLLTAYLNPIIVAPTLHGMWLWCVFCAFPFAWKVYSWWQYSLPNVSGARVFAEDKDTPVCCLKMQLNHVFLCPHNDELIFSLLCSLILAWQHICLGSYATFPHFSSLCYTDWATEALKPSPI